LEVYLKGFPSELTFVTLGHQLLDFLPHHLAEIRPVQRSIGICPNLWTKMNPYSEQSPQGIEAPLLARNQSHILDEYRNDRHLGGTGDEIRSRLTFLYPSTITAGPLGENDEVEAPARTAKGSQLLNAPLAEAIPLDQEAHFGAQESMQSAPLPDRPIAEHKNG
jgi:hypothetical protein